MEQKRQRERSGPIASWVGKNCEIAEMLYREDTHATLFACLRDGSPIESATINLPHLGARRPYSPDNNLISHRVVLFPSAVNECGTDMELLTEVRQFIHRFADLSLSFEEIAAHYVLLTWVYDAFNELPYLRLKGDFGSGKSRCLQTIGSLCYKPMFVSGASTVSPMFRIIDAFRGTLILDESDFRFSDERAEIVKILNNGNAAGFPVLRSEVNFDKEFNPRAFNVFGPKIIASRTLFDDRALESRCITENMTGLPPRADIPLSLPKSFHSEALALRNKLLGYRFRRLHQVQDLGLRLPGVEPRVAQVFGPLLSVAADDATRSRIVDLATKQSQSIHSERSGSTEAQLLAIIFEMRRDGEALAIKEIARRFSERFAADFDRPITPRWIGAQIRRRLSVVPVKSVGVFVIPVTENTKLNALAARYDLGDIAVDGGTLGTSVAAGTPKAA